MQNFTLGKRGLSMLFFAFILLIGSSPTFGQACPTPEGTDENQTFCYLQTVGDIVTDGNAFYQTANNENDTQPIPESELLTDGVTYYAGSTSGDCTRRPVTVTVNNAPRPANIITNSIVSGFEFTTCTPATFNSEDLADLFVSQSDEYRIEVYASEESTEPLVNVTLNAGDSYYVGQVPINPGQPNAQPCPSFRVAVGFNPNQIEGPTAEAVQTFCEAATVADLVAQGTYDDTQAIRWYRSQTANSPLSDNTQLINGQFYYAAQVVNERGSPLPPCETPAEDRTPVVVELTPENNIEETQRFCESIGEGNDFRMPEVQDLSPAGDWYADDSFTTPLDPNTELVDGEDYYQRGSTECEVLIVTADFFSTPNAGRTTETSFCENDEPENLVNRINDSQLGAPDQNGSFTPALSTGTNIFNPADYNPGSYTFTYTVEGNEDCPTDTTQVTVIVEEAPNAGDDVNEQVCSAQLNIFPALIAQFSSLLEGRDTGGTFTPSLESLFAQYNTDPSGPFSTVYTVGAEGECRDSAQLTVTVIDSPNAGENGSVVLSRNDAPFNLFTELEGTPDADGTWSPGNADGSFDPATGEAGTYTYTVTNGECTDTATVSVSFEDECPVVETTTQSFCQSIGEGNNFRRPRISDLMPAGVTWYTSADSDEPITDNRLLVDGTTYYAGNAQGTCEDRTPVLVNIDQAPNAGRTTALTVCSNEAPFDLVSRINESILGAPDAGGTFTPALASGTTVFNPAVDVAGTYTYTVESPNDACPDDISLITVRITEVNAGEDGTVEVSREDAPFNLFSELNGTPTTGGTWSPGNVDGTFTPATGEAGTYTYTVTNGTCTDTATVTVTITEEIECPVVADTEQAFCQSIGEGNDSRRPRVSDLLPTGATWYATEDSDIALASNTVLVDGTTYFAGNSQGTCNDRTGVLVNLDDSPNAGRTTALTVCSNEAAFDLVSRINEAILGAPDAGGTFTPALASGSTIFDPAVDVAGQYTYRVESTNDACPDDTSSITVNITNVNAGENGTVEVSREDAPFNLFSELNGTPDASGTWSPGNANGSFNPATGEAGTYTYTVTNGNCTDTATVTVTITEEIECPVVADTEQAFCQSIGEGNDSRRPRVSDLMPTGATWYATATSTEAFAANTVLIDGEDYFAGNANGNCTSRERVVVTLDQAPNAGRTTALTVCSNEAAFDLVSRINESILGAPDAGGTFTPALASGSTIFDPAVDVAGQYTYRVESTNDACPDDTSSITITKTNGIVEAPINETVCSAELNNLGNFVNEFSSLLEGRDTGGTFAPTLETLFVQYTTSPIGNFTTVYTVGAEGECQSSVEINVTVLESPNAGEDGTVEVSRENAPFNLFTELNGTPDTGGTWSPGNADGSFDPATGEADTYIYTVTNGTCTDTATVTVTITDEPLCPVVTDNTQSFCESIDVGNASRRPRVSDLMPANAVWYETATSTTPLASTIVLINGEDYFAGNADVTCPARPRVVVTLDESPNAGRTTDITVCSDDASFDLLDRINESILGAPDAGGTFSPALASGTTVFNPAVDVATTYTYRVESTNDVCPADTAQITVRINQSGEANAGDPFTLDYCVTAEDVDLFAELGEGVTQGGTFEGYPNGIFSPATLGEGTYVVNYNVGEGLPCITGTDSSTLTITVTATGETPVAEAEQSFCLVNDPTVADIVVTGEGDIVIYEDAELTTVADETSPLVDGADYYAVSSSEGNACGSDAVVITVVLTDADAPTLIDEVEGGEFCRSDNPTVQELISNLNGSGIQIYTSLTGGTALATTTALEDGVTYFASATNSTTQCESSERRAVEVEVGFCGIPEGFSPNDDGVNDEFVIPDIATDFPNYTIQVYNRWGSLVFEGNASTGDWDGLSNQSATLGDGVLPAGVYFYILDYNDGQTQPVQGKVYLSR